MTVLTSGLSLRSDLKNMKTEVFDSKLSKGQSSSKMMTLDTKSKIGLMTKSKLDLRPTSFKVGFQIDNFTKFSPGPPIVDTSRNNLTV